MSDQFFREIKAYLSTAQKNILWRAIVYGLLSGIVFCLIGAIVYGFFGFYQIYNLVALGTILTAGTVTSRFARPSPWVNLLALGVIIITLSLVFYPCRVILALPVILPFCVLIDHQIFK